MNAYSQIHSDQHCQGLVVDLNCCSLANFQQDLLQHTTTSKWFVTGLGLGFAARGHNDDTDTEVEVKLTQELILILLF